MTEDEGAEKILSCDLENAGEDTRRCILCWHYGDADPNVSDYCKTGNIRPALFSATHEELLFRPALNSPSYNIDYTFNLYQNVYSPLF